jgi:hypothetical protein
VSTGGREACRRRTERNARGREAGRARLGQQRAAQVRRRRPPRLQGVRLTAWAKTYPRTAPANARWRTKESGGGRRRGRVTRRRAHTACIATRPPVVPTRNCTDGVSEKRPTDGTSRTHFAYSAGTNALADNADGDSPLNDMRVIVMQSKRAIWRRATSNADEVFD